MDDDVLELAARLGLQIVECRSCNPLIDPQCAVCEGTGYLWRDRAGTLVARSQVLRLGAALPRAGAGKTRPRDPRPRRR